MRFGVTAFDAEHLSDLAQIGSTVSLPEIFERLSFQNLIKRVYESGFKLAEITLDMYYVIPGSLDEEIAEEIRELGKKLGVSYTAHLPLWSLEPGSPVPQIRKASVDAIVETIQIAEIFKPEVYVLHATGPLAAEFTRMEAPPLVKEVLNEMFYNNALESVEKIIDKTGIDPKRLAIENIEFEFKYTRKIVDELDTSICFDTGHLLAGYSGKYDVFEFLDWNFEKIAEIHLHDGYKIKKNGFTEIKDHIPLGKGKLPVCKFLEYLQNRKYDGPIIFELPLSWAKQSIEYIKSNCPNIKIE
ncbi:MAG: cobamide remodeling phosphodiesterase CbiR [Candidatus Asgardarchaeia archaeon]